MQRPLFALLFALGLTLPADAADQQTKEGAQEFLSILAAQGNLSLESRYGAGEDWNSFPYMDADASREPTPDEIRWLTYYTGPSRVTQVTNAPCASTFTYKWVNFQMPYDRQALKPGRQYITDETQRVPWSRIASVTRTGSSIVLVWGTMDLKLVLPSEDLAKRAEYAAEFLRLACDASSATGF